MGMYNTVKFQIQWTPPKTCLNYPEWFDHTEMRQKDTDGIADNIDTDQTAPGLGLLCFPRPSKLFRISMVIQYCKNPKISDTRKFAVITLKVEQDGFSLE